MKWTPEYTKEYYKKWNKKRRAYKREWMRKRRLDPKYREHEKASLKSNQGNAKWKALKD